MELRHPAHSTGSVRRSIIVFLARDRRQHERAIISGEARDFEVGGFCKRRGSTKSGGLGDGSPPAGCRGRAPVGGGAGGRSPPEAERFFVIYA